MTSLYALDLTGRRAVIIGGGPAAAEHARQLVSQGANVEVVAAFLCEDLVDLARTGAITATEREPVAGDLDTAWFVIAATGSDAEDTLVQTWAQAARVWCAAGADRTASARPVPTVAAAGAQIGVLATSPAHAQRVQASVRDAVDTGAVDLRAPAPGSVTLVGGGPGDPDLITVAGRRALAAADVIVADRLGPVSVLTHVRPGVEVINVGKSPGHHPVPQHEINQILVEQAQRGRRVVRLKGGDPFLLGRGGEELQALVAAGVPANVIPGITSAFSVPALSGIPVTQRDVVHAVHVTSGHEPLSAAAIASVVDGAATLVVLMGVSNLGHLTGQLLQGGADAVTPVAIIERGTTPQQRTTSAPLHEIVAAAAAAKVRAPAIIVVGHVAAPELLTAR